jgi:hypothetical protein
MTRGRRLLALALVAVAIGLVGPAAAATGASPEPSFAPVQPPALFQAWLDSEFIVPDAPPGGVLEAGFTFWNTRSQDFGGIGGVYARMRPATGDAAPSEATIEEDFPGHVIATFVVPEGGPGAVEVGTRVDTCVNDVCGEAEAPFTISGVGPPPNADPASLVTASFLPFVGDTVVGRAFPVTVNVQPRGLWDAGALPLPDALEVVAAAPANPTLASAPLVPGAQPGAPWTGRLTIPQLGPVELTVHVPNPDGVGRVIAGEPAELTAIEGGRPGTSAPVATAAPGPEAPVAGGDEGGIPAIVMVGSVVVGLVGVGLVLRRVLADL